MILCLGTTPAVQRVMFFRSLTLDAVNRARVTLDGAAGKSINTAKVLCQLGAQPLALGFLGGDRGDFLRTTLAEQGVPMDFVTVATRTRQCVTVIDETTGAHTELVEESQPVAPEDYVRLRERFQQHLPGSQAVVLSGTITPGGPVDFYAECIRLAHAAGIPTLLDAQGAPLLAALPERPALVKPNRAELAATTGRKLETEPEVLAAMDELAARGAARVVVTSGSGPVLARHGNQGWRLRAPTIRAINPIGSGDAFTAGLTWRLAQGDDLSEACRWGCAAGAANALTPMAGEVELAEVRRLASQVAIERIP